MTEKKDKPKLPKYSRLFDFVMLSPKLSPAEKLIITCIARHFPNPCWQSNKSLAADCGGFTERYVEMLLARLKKHNPPYIEINYQQEKNRKGKLVTKRTIIVNSAELKYEKKLLKTNLMPGRNRPNNPTGFNRTTVRSATEQSFGQPTEQSFTPLLKDSIDKENSGSNPPSPGKRSNPSKDKKKKHEGKTEAKPQTGSLDLIVQAFEGIPDDCRAELKIEKMPVKPQAKPIDEPMSHREFMERVRIQRGLILPENN